jgi:Pyruvate/2-oxoacid:ferredoxin oxidoreductase delta subunit
MDRCLLGRRRDCSLCRNFCPWEAITTDYSETDDSLKLRIDPARCSGCGACQVSCPTDPVKAIVVGTIKLIK